MSIYCEKITSQQIALGGTDAAVLMRPKGQLEFCAVRRTASQNSVNKIDTMSILFTPHF
jgi:hypothetical protein